MPSAKMAPVAGPTTLSAFLTAPAKMPPAFVPPALTFGESPIFSTAPSAVAVSATTRTRRSPSNTSVHPTGRAAHRAVVKRVPCPPVDAALEGAPGESGLRIRRSLRLPEQRHGLASLVMSDRQDRVEVGHRVVHGGLDHGPIDLSGLDALTLHALLTALPKE